LTCACLKDIVELADICIHVPLVGIVDEYITNRCSKKSQCTFKSIIVIHCSKYNRPSLDSYRPVRSTPALISFVYQPNQLLPSSLTTQTKTLTIFDLIVGFFI
jgi:hypothetical protein